MDKVIKISPDSSKRETHFELNKEFFFKGLWWFPKKYEERRYGVLYFKHSKGLVLNVIEDFDITSEIGESERKNFSDFLTIENSLIKGILCSGEIVTLTGCTEMNAEISLAGVKCISILAETAFVGVHFNRTEDIKFKRISANFVHLDQWIDLTACEGSLVPGSEVTLTCKYKDPVSINIKDKFKLLVGNRIFGPKLPLRKKIEIIQKSYIEIIPRESKSFGEYLNLFDHIQSFLSLAIRRPIFPYIVEGLPELETEENENKGISQPAKILFSIRELLEKYDEIPKNEMLFTFSDVSDRLEMFLNKWFDNANFLKPIYDIYFVTLDESYSFLQNQFLNLVQAIESFHRVFECNEEMDKKEFDKRIEIILNAVPNTYKSWLKYKLKYSNEPSLKSRLKEIIGRYSKITETFIKDEESFSEEVATNRNYLTHLDPSSRVQISEPGELFELLQKLKILLLICLLGFIGFKEDEIEQMMISERWYRRFSRNQNKRR